jgi:hypothetical protein
MEENPCPSASSVASVFYRFLKALLFCAWWLHGQFDVMGLNIKKFVWICRFCAIVVRFLNAPVPFTERLPGFFVSCAGNVQVNNLL